MSDPQSKPEDELAGSEQPFVAHLIELRDRLIWAVAAVAIASLATRSVASTAPAKHKHFKASPLTFGSAALPFNGLQLPYAH